MDTFSFVYFTSAVFVSFITFYALHATLQQVLLPNCFIRKTVHSSHRKDGYDDQWRYYPGYDASFDDDCRRRGEMYGDEFDRRSVHSEQSAHSVHSSHSHHSRRSSISSRSQQVNVQMIFLVYLDVLAFFTVWYYLAH